MVFRCFYRSIQCTIPLSFVKNCWSSGSAIVPFASIFSGNNTKLLVQVHLLFFSKFISFSVFMSGRNCLLVPRRFRSLGRRLFSFRSSSFPSPLFMTVSPPQTSNARPSPLACVNPSQRLFFFISFIVQCTLPIFAAVC